ncbi:hypothetical protein D3C78_1887450 [compost metagenome]
MMYGVNSKLVLPCSLNAAWRVKNSSGMFWMFLALVGIFPLLLSVTAATSLRGAPAPRSSRLISFFAILISLLY